ncbi:hypothetical protein M3J09_010012 [Ascochyta lentis]
MNLEADPHSVCPSYVSTVHYAKQRPNCEALCAPTSEPDERILLRLRPTTPDLALLTISFTF